ncbi:MAG: hypothetical protein A3G71_01245 [Gammaproteobacteria bacterium RIFCSPLOWO2_12_FULL_38_14]|nr:MAG: hypothetical protein A3G71_01245 [Gammaproteobacteria bacterium RIFCSPLOWO2_12_FULL_38_14]
MRTYASGLHSSCDDLHSQKSSCVVVHVAVFAQSDHRNLNAIPGRNFASSRGKGYSKKTFVERTIIMLETASSSTSLPPSSSEEKSAFNGFTKLFFSVPEEKKEDSMLVKITVFPRVGEDFEKFLKSERGGHFKREIEDGLKKLKDKYTFKSQLGDLLDGEILFEKLLKKKTLDQSSLDYINAFSRIVELIQQEKLLPMEMIQKSLKDFFDSELDESKIKNIFIGLTKTAVEKYVEILKSWATQHGISLPSREVFNVFNCYFSANIIRDERRGLLFEGVRLLEKICLLMQEDKIKESKYWAISGLLSDLGVCEPGVLTHLEDTYRQLIAGPEFFLMNIRKDLAQDIGGRILQERFPERDRGMDIHVLNTLFGLSQSELGVTNVEDHYASNDYSVKHALEIQDEFVSTFKAKCRPEYILEKILKNVGKDIQKKMELLNSEEISEEQDKSAIVLQLYSSFEDYGKDENFNFRRFLFDQAVLEQSEYKKYVLSVDANDILVESFIRRLIQSGHLVKRDFAFERAYFRFMEILDSQLGLTQEQINELFTKREYERIGMQVAAMQDATITQKYLKLLQQGVENKQVPPEKIAVFLMEQDEEGGSLGMAVARYQDAASTQQYFNLLQKWCEDGLLKSDEVVRLLTQKNQRGLSLGMFVVRNQDATITQKYLKLLQQGIENKQVPPEKIAVLLVEKDEEGNSLGMAVARYQDAASTQQYFNLLQKCCDDGLLKSDEVVKILTQKNKRGRSLGIIVARNQDALSMQQYFNFLQKCMGEGLLKSDEVFGFLTEQGGEGWSLGMFVARHQDALITQQYFKLLSWCVDHGLSSREQLLLCLISKNNFTWHLGMYLAFYQDALSTQQYFNLLQCCLEKELLKPDEAVRFLGQQNDQGWSLGMLVARYQDATTVQNYFDFLEKIIRTDLSFMNNVLFLLCLHSHDDQTMERLMGSAIFDKIRHLREIAKEKDRIQKEEGLSPSQAQLWIRYEQKFKTHFLNNDALTQEKMLEIARLPDSEVENFYSKTKILQGKLKVDVLSEAFLKKVNSTTQRVSSEEARGLLKLKFANQMIAFVEQESQCDFSCLEKAALYTYAAHSKMATLGAVVSKTRASQLLEKMAEGERKASEEMRVNAYFQRLH